jgi:hypothetical protein
MITRNLLLASVLCFVAACSDGAYQAVAENDAADSAQVMAPERTEPGTVFVTYFHGDQRCATCMKLEAYSHEAVEEAFASELADSSLVWRTVNYDQKGNEHYIEDYGLFTKAVILTRVVGGEEVEWKNLDEIWDRVGDRKDFVVYVQEGLRSFLQPAEDQDG